MSPENSMAQKPEESLPLLQGQGLGLEISGKNIVQNVTINISQGERIALIGQNGAGKSTLLDMLCGLRPPSAGKILWRGQDLRQINRRVLAQRIAVVPQREDLPPDLRVIELVLMGRAPYQRGLGLASGEDQELAHRALTELDLQGFAGRRLGSLSGGERQRVLVARALVQQPELLILDEPTSALDLGHALYIAHLVQKLAARGVAVLSAVHDLNQVPRFAQRLWLLREGALVLDAPLSEALQPEVLGPLLDVHLLAGELGGWPVLIAK